MVHKIDQKDLEVGATIEKSEHPWMSKSQARRTAKDHIAEDPNAYAENKGGGGKSVVILNQNVKAMAPRKKKKPVAKSEPTGPQWIPNNLRMWG